VDSGPEWRALPRIECRPICWSDPPLYFPLTTLHSSSEKARRWRAFSLGATRVEPEKMPICEATELVLR
jgi:hypothetical protein